MAEIIFSNTPLCKTFILTLLRLILVFFLVSTTQSYSKEDTDIPKPPSKPGDVTQTESSTAKCSAPEISAKQGKLCGIDVKTSSGMGAYAYLGIPYAETTGWENRWRPPVPDSGWDGVLQATKFGLACPQKNIFYPNLPTSEDCLSINVWTPAAKSDKPRAVMVFIYGGAFKFGYSSEPTYNGAYTAANGDVIVVSMNYRLASLGFLAGLKDKKTGEEINGNFGLLDQILALKWVQENIGAFGGDPEKVTIYGESAGAMSVGIHLAASPQSENLFRAAIMQSNPLGFPFKTVDQAKPVAEQLASGLGCESDDLACLRSKGPDEILSALSEKEELENTVLYGLRDFLLWGPVIDGEIFTGHPIDMLRKKKSTKPFIIGTNKDEGMAFVGLSLKKLGVKELGDLEYSLALDVLFRNKDLENQILSKYPKNGQDNTIILGQLLTDYLFACPTLSFAGESKNNTWLYQFNQQSSFDNFAKMGVSQCREFVCHAAELVFVFNTAQNAGDTFTPQEEMLSQKINGYWTSFAKDLEPKGSSLNWPGYKPRDSIMIFNTPSNLINTKQNIYDKCAFWDKQGYHSHSSFWGLF